MFKKTITILALVLLVASCRDSLPENKETTITTTLKDNHTVNNYTEIIKDNHTVTTTTTTTTTSSTHGRRKQTPRWKTRMLM